ncbi:MULTISPECIES: hypothetical protein [Streptomyces]|uniref:hypothetical protein n=1 Tax=Streptomyces TaxID=1883 RepID=UPI00131B3C9A|nr:MULTISPECIES: hypothetical protein [Streptomyces]MDI5907794.1 hypothetical protein [Streptomyces sp. 12257]
MAAAPPTPSPSPCEWSTNLTCAVLRDLSHREIALRNAYAAAPDAMWTGNGALAG